MPAFQLLAEKRLRIKFPRRVLANKSLSLLGIWGGRTRRVYCIFMNNKDIIRLRLINQQIASTRIADSAGMVEWMIAMQAQEFAMAKWAIGLRLQGSTDTIVEKAFNEGAILRTHVMRPTWHFVSPADIRWLQMLTSPRVQAGNAYVGRQENFDNKLLNKSTDILIRALEGGKHLTRTELQDALKQKKIVADGLKLAYIVMHAELNAVICSGPRKGKQFTYALLDERVPATNKLTKDEALSELARRYFTSRGPATIHDLAYWSGLTIADAKQAAASLPVEFERNKAGDKEYIFLPSSATVKTNTATFLMPDYDEWGMSYKDRQALTTDKPIIPRFKQETSEYSHWLVIDGQIAGSWKLSVNKGSAVVDAKPFVKIPASKEATVKKAVNLYLKFIKTSTK